MARVGVGERAGRRRESNRPGGGPLEARVGVWIVSDVRLYREGLGQSLEHDGRLKVLGGTDRIADVLAFELGARPVVVLLDMALPDALLAVRSLRERSPKMSVVALGVADRTRHIVECVEAGVVGYVCRDHSLEDLVGTVVKTAEGKLECSSRVAGALVRRLGRLAALNGPDPEAAHLTVREREIAELIDEGLSNKEIAARLHIEVSTAKNHVHNILEKLGVRRRGEAAARLRRAGLLPASRVERRHHL